MTDPGARSTVLVVGIGEVGRHLLELLVRDDDALDLVAADIDMPALQAKVDNARFGAALQGRRPSVRAVAIDLFDQERTAALLAELQPQVVVNCAVLQTWHVVRRLPADVYTRLSSAGLGAWLPVQLTLAMNLGRAIRTAGVSCHYVNTSLSDLTNPVLGAMGMPPTIGIGNVALIQIAVCELAARRLGRPSSEVDVKLVAHHVHWVTWREAGYREGAPFYMKILAGGEDVTSRFDTLELMKSAIRLYPGDTTFSAVSASSAVRNLKALLAEKPVSTHSPGPNGLPGGYPVLLSEAGAEVELPPEITLEEAIALNTEAQTYDGVRAIDSDARVHFMPYAIEIMKEVLGFDCPSFTPDECADLAREQMRRFQDLVRRHGA